MASCFRPRKARYEWADYPSVRLSPSPTKHSRVTAAIKSQSQVLGFIQRTSGRPQVYVRKTVSINSDILKGRDVPREYETWSSLGHHPHILACEDFQCSVNKYALDEATFWSEYCEMGDLGQYVCIDVTRKRTLSARQAEQIIHQITSALVFIHYGIRITVDKQGCIEDVEMSEHPTLIHRDIKPQNIFISYLDFDNPSDGEIHVKLGDFGCAKQLDDISSMTITGTVGYQAPESRCRTSSGNFQRPSASVKSDVWSFGATIRDITDYKPEFCQYCCQEDPESRPSSVQLLEYLQGQIKPAGNSSLLVTALSKDANEPFWDLPLIERILEAGADPNAIGQGETTALQFMAGTGNKSNMDDKAVSELLLKHGASPQITPGSSMCNEIFIVPDTLLESQTRVTTQINYDDHDRTVEMEDFEEPIQTTDALDACTPNDQLQPMEWLDYLHTQIQVSYGPTDVAGSEGFASTPLDAFTPSEYSFDARTVSSDGYAEIFPKRALGSHLDPVVAKAAHDMRGMVACWHCILQRDKCGPGDTCERCLRRSQRPNAEPGLGCSRIKLVELSLVFLPALVRQFYEDASLTDFVQTHIRQWTKNEITIYTTPSIDTLPRIPLRCYEFLPREPMSEAVNPPLGMVHILGNEEKRYDQYLNDIVNHHIEGFIQIWLNEGDEDFQKKLFCLLIHVNLKTENEAKLFKEVLRLIVSTYIMSNSLFWVENPSGVRRFTPSATPFEFPYAHFAARQVKYFFARLQRQILTTVLNKLQQVFKSSKGCSHWLAAFVAVLGLAMANEEEQKAIHLVQTTQVHTETFSFGKDYAQAANVACQEIDLRMDFIFQVFRWKYHRRWNPLKDSDRDWAGEFGFGDENSQIIREVSQLVKENTAFLQTKQYGTVEQANMKNFTSHLVAKFLLSFWLPQ